MPELPIEAFHFVDAVNWASVETEGLHSTDTLLRMAAFPPDVVAAARNWRSAGLLLPNGRYIRDQRPMPAAALGPSLDDGLAPADWYELLNTCVFFWLSADRAANHRRALRHRPQMLIRLDARRLAAAYADIACVSPFNLGNARRQPARRGLRSLVPVDVWQKTAWQTERPPPTAMRSPSHKPAELVLRGSVPDFLRYVTAIEALPAY
ncbi:MAG TPA: hypothetical protein VGV37_16925 [Aliidongia sp.]|uniref:DUF7002 family protein n=1 Tax=Aliidongia sp. TaxID=1914230 RepID=UPI002DDCDAD2|nr:hypothetical protein [Aliidongia sp.]HEV2676211.1 hypothetical protein [Aliidongia sp.]